MKTKVILKGLELLNKLPKGIVKMSNHKNKDGILTTPDLDVLGSVLGYILFSSENYRESVLNMFGGEYKVLKSILVGRLSTRLLNNTENVINHFGHKPEFKKVLEEKLSNLFHREFKLNSYDLKGSQAKLAHIAVSYCIELMQFKHLSNVKSYVDEAGELKYSTQVELVNPNYKGKIKKSTRLKESFWLKEPEGSNGYVMYPKLIGSPISLDKVISILLDKLRNQSFSLNTELWNQIKDKAYSLRKDVSMLKNKLSRAYEPWVEKALENINIEWNEVDKVYNSDELVGFNWFTDSRGRIYSKNPVEGLNPLGKLYQVMLMESPEKYKLDKVGVKYLRHLFASHFWRELDLETKRPKFNPEVGFNLDSKAKWIALAAIDSFTTMVNQAKDLDELGEVVLGYKLAKDYLGMLNCAKPEEYKTKSLYGRDLNNSGLIMAVSSFRQKELYPITGLDNGDKVLDSHQNLADKLGLDRNAVKKAHTAFLHGASLEATCSDIRYVVVEQMMNQKDKVVMDAYIKFSQRKENKHLFKNQARTGYEKFIRWYSNELINSDSSYYDPAFAGKYNDEVLTAGLYATYGNLVDIVNTIQKLSRTLAPLGQVVYKTLDGQRWFTENFIAKTSFKYRYPKLDNELSDRSIFNQIEDKNFKDLLQFTLNNKGSYEIDYPEKGELKVSGMFANLTHSKDAYVLRKVISNVSLILPKHDDYITRLDEMGIVDASIREAIVEADSGEYENHYIDAIVSIKDLLIKEKKRFYKDPAMDHYYGYLIEEVTKTIGVLKTYTDSNDKLSLIKGNNFISL
jgi:hypothetical protein